MTQKLVEDMYGQKGLFQKKTKDVLAESARLQESFKGPNIMVKPKQKTPIREGHFSSPLRGASAKKHATTGSRCDAHALRHLAWWRYV